MLSTRGAADKPTTVLVVDDEQNLVELVRGYLERDGFAVLSASDGLSAVALAHTGQPDLVILDLMLPGLDGIEVCRRLRQFSDAYVLMLTARAEEVDKIVGLSVGADDYLTKPFSPRELVARIQALLRRSRPDHEPRALEVGALRVDPGTHEASVRGHRLALTPREFALLAFLARHPGRVHSREELLRKVWGYDYVGETRTVDVHVRRLRAKLGAARRMIETVTGSGYKLTTPSGAA